MPDRQTLWFYADADHPLHGKLLDISKPTQCNCDFPAAIYRNTVGHANTCPIFQRAVDQHRRAHTMPLPSAPNLSRA
jgi:hypothetical protein